MTDPEKPPRLLGPALRRRWWPVAAGAVLATLHQASETAVPVVVGLVIDQAVVTGDASAMVLWAGVVVGLFLVLGTAGLFGYYLLERAEQWIAHDVRALVVARALDPRGGVRARSGETVSLASNDAKSVGQVAFVVGLSIAVLPPLVGGTVVLLTISVPLALVVLGGLPVVLVVVALLSRPLTTRMHDEQTAIASTTGVATDLLHGLRVLKGLGAEPAGAQRYELASRRALAARLRSAKFLGGYTGVTLGVSGFFLVVVAWVGGRLALAGDITVGELVTAVGLAQFLVAPLGMLTGIGADLASVRASAKRVQALLRTPPAVQDPGVTPAHGGVGDVALRDVVAGPFDGLELTVTAGEHLGVVASPAESATLLDLLARRRDPETGSVTLDGASLADWPLPELHRRLLVAEHDAVLFSGSLEDNLRAASGTGADLSAALAAGAADQVAATVPGGLAAVLDEGGSSLSGGQRQRIALARALAADPDVLVLHDPTTAVDSATEHTIAGRLAAVRDGRTTLVLASSPALLAACDRVVVIREGRVAASGHHADLAASDTGYRQAVLG